MARRRGWSQDNRHTYEFPAGRLASAIEVTIRETRDDKRAAHVELSMACAHLQDAQTEQAMEEHAERIGDAAYKHNRLVSRLSMLTAMHGLYRSQPEERIYELDIDEIAVIGLKYGETRLGEAL